MAAFYYEITICAKGKAKDVRELWLSMSAPGLKGRDFDFSRLLPWTECDEFCGRRLTDGFIKDLNSASQSFIFEEIRAEPSVFYEALAAAFPRLGLFCYHLCEPNNSMEAQVAWYMYEAGELEDYGIDEVYDRDEERGKIERMFSKCRRQAKDWLKTEFAAAESPQEMAPRKEWLKELAALEKGAKTPDGQKALEDFVLTYPAALGYLRRIPQPLAITAVRSDPWALRFIPNPGEAEYRAAVEGCSTLADFPADFLCPPVCRIAVETNGANLAHVPKKFLTAELYRLAIADSGLALAAVPEKHRSAELCAAAVFQNPLALEFVPEERRSPELCREAYTKDANTLQFIPPAIAAQLGGNPYLAAAEKDFRVLKTLTAEQQSYEVCLAALKQNPFAAFRMIKNQTPEICLEAVKLDGLNILPLVKNQTPEICRAAVAQNPRAQMFVRKTDV